MIDTKKWISVSANGKETVRIRQERQRHLDDDLPDVVKAYKEFKEKLL